jgi:FtsH-binding integral membrane protein
VALILRRLICREEADLTGAQGQTSTGVKLLATMFSLFGVLALIITASCRWGFINPQLHGPEEGLIVGSLAFFAGAVASILATVFAFIASRRPNSAKGSGLLLGCGGVLLLGFVIVLIA